LDPQNDHVIWAPNLIGWRDVALRPALEKQLGLPVFVEYDGHAAVLGEWWTGAGKGFDSCVDIIIGTGIGGGMILEGHLVRGLNRLAGAAGWSALTTQAKTTDTTDHSRGHWESLAAGPGIVRRAQASLAAFPDSALAAIPSPELSARQIFAAARQGDLLAMQVVDETADLIGLGVANIVSLVNPEIVILGGSVGAQGDLLLPRVREVVGKWAQPISARSVTIQSSSLGTDAGLLGAAYAALLRTQTSENGVFGN
jgi:glucokinase